MAKKDELGRWGEDIAAQYLADLGYEVVERNWRCSAGEIDIIARREGFLVVVEVKTRSTRAFGHPFEAVTAAKLARLRRLGFAWCASRAGWHGPIRVDVVAVVGAPAHLAAPAVQLFERVAS